MLAIVLRVCLALSVLLNGAGPAMAAVHAPDSAIAAAETPCHEAGDDGLAGSRTHPAGLDAAATRMPESSGQSADDCCGGGPCECACVQPGHVPLPAVTGVPPVAIALEASRAMRSRHASPTLPHLIRPPIS